MTLDRFLKPRSVAVIGATKTETKRGYQSIRTMLSEKFEGAIYPVNPKESSILGIKCYKRVTDIEGPVDLALIATPAATVPAILKTCGEKHVAGAVVLAGGFRETGRQGQILEEEILTVARQSNIRIIGPTPRA